MNAIFIKIFNNLSLLKNLEEFDKVLNFLRFCDNNKTLETLEKEVTFLNDFEEIKKIFSNLGIILEINNKKEDNKEKSNTPEKSIVNNKNDEYENLLKEVYK